MGRDTVKANVGKEGIEVGIGLDRVGVGVEDQGLGRRSRRTIGFGIDELELRFVGP